MCSFLFWASNDLPEVEKIGGKNISTIEFLFIVYSKINIFNSYFSLKFTILLYLIGGANRSAKMAKDNTNCVQLFL